MFERLKERNTPISREELAELAGEGVTPTEFIKKIREVREDISNHALRASVMIALQGTEPSITRGTRYNTETGQTEDIFTKLEE